MRRLDIRFGRLAVLMRWRRRRRRCDGLVGHVVRCIFITGLGISSHDSEYRYGAKISSRDKKGIWHTSERAGWVLDLRPFKEGTDDRKEGTDDLIGSYTQS